MGALGLRKVDVRYIGPLSWENTLFELSLAQISIFFVGSGFEDAVEALKRDGNRFHCVVFGSRGVRQVGDALVGVKLKQHCLQANLCGFEVQLSMYAVYLS